MKRLKIIAGITMVCLVMLLAGCRNNLVNEWVTYTGETDYYYQEPTESGEPEMTTTEAVTVETTESAESVTAYGLPDYWNDELWNVVDDSLERIQNAEGNRTTFLWYNDAHLSYSALRNVSILEFLQKQTGVQFINFGGDIVNTYGEEDDSKIVSQLYEWRDATLLLFNHHSVVGNHDDDIEEFFDREALHTFLIENEAEKTSADVNPFCYYADNADEKTRYIYLSTGLEETTSDDLRFLVNALSGTQKDWHIVVVSHIWFSYYDTLTPTVGEVPEFSQVILDVLDDYNARETGYEREVEYDFTSAEAKVEFCIGGHTHVDFEFRTDGGIPVILNETDSYHLRGDSKSIDGTDEASVSVVVADYNEKVIYIIRAGRGESRTVLLP